MTYFKKNWRQGGKTAPSGSNQIWRSLKERQLSLPACLTPYWWAHLLLLPLRLLCSSSDFRMRLLFHPMHLSFHPILLSSGSLQTSITRLRLQRHLVLWVEQGMKFSALQPSSQTIGLPRQNHGSQSNKSLLYPLFILLIFYRNLIQILGMVYPSYVDWGDESNS